MMFLLHSTRELDNILYPVSIFFSSKDHQLKYRITCLKGKRVEEVSINEQPITYIIHFSDTSSSSVTEMEGSCLRSGKEVFKKSVLPATINCSPHSPQTPTLTLWVISFRVWVVHRGRIHYIESV